MKDIFEQIWKLAEPYLDTRRNDIHTKVVMRYAQELLEKEGGDEDIVIPAAILHDVGWKAIPEEDQLKGFGPKMSRPELKRMHETEGAKTARQILETVGYDAGKTGTVLKIIEGHDTTKEAFSTEDAIVKDSDRLWRFSKEGFYIDKERFGESFDEIIKRLTETMEKQLITGSAKRIAQEELQKRMKEGEERGEDPEA